MAFLVVENSRLTGGHALDGLVQLNAYKSVRLHFESGGTFGLVVSGLG